MLVENSVVLEIKAVSGYMPDLFKYQVLSYLRASGLKVGLLVNFGNKSCQIKRLMF
ncbi:MAG: GxxExxY protein [Candidatus Omnitrophica bacterium]|nr:GxxExxY protein [Candidatus Omnitrophota bacterium]